MSHRPTFTCKSRLRRECQDRVRTDSQIRLRDTTTHSAQETASRGAQAEGNGAIFDLGRGEEQDGTLGRGLNPSLQTQRFSIHPQGENQAQVLTQGIRPW